MKPQKAICKKCKEEYVIYPNYNENQILCEDCLNEEENEKELRKFKNED